MENADGSRARREGIRQRNDGPAQAGHDCGAAKMASVPVGLIPAAAIYY